MPESEQKVKEQRSLMRRNIIAALNEEESILLLDVEETQINVIFTDGERFGIRITGHPHIDAEVRSQRRLAVPPVIGTPYGTEPWADQ